MRPRPVATPPLLLERTGTLILTATSTARFRATGSVEWTTSVASTVRAAPGMVLRMDSRARGPSLIEEYGELTNGILYLSSCADVDHNTRTTTWNRFVSVATFVPCAFRQDHRQLTPPTLAHLSLDRPHLSRPTRPTRLRTPRTPSRGTTLERSLTISSRPARLQSVPRERPLWPRARMLASSPPRARRRRAAVVRSRLVGSSGSRLRGGPTLLSELHLGLVACLGFEGPNADCFHLSLSLCSHNTRTSAHKLTRIVCLYCSADLVFLSLCFPSHLGRPSPADAGPGRR